MKYFIAVVIAIGVAIVASPAAFAECASGYTQITVPLCKLTSTSAPVINSSLTASGTVGVAFSYTITATNTPTSFNATSLPGGLSVNTSTGVISGTPTTAATTNVGLSATNSGGTGTATLVLTISSAPPTGFYVSTTGSDSNAGTLAAPFATLGKCQTAMQGSGTKTCYIRAGSYTPAAGPACGSGNCAITLSSSDNGETWSDYPPDGVDSADITGGSTASGNGLWAIFDAGSSSNVTITGLSMHNFDFAAIRSTGGPSHLTVTNNLMFNGFFIVGSGPQSAGGFMCYDCTNLTVTHNVVHDIASFGITNDYSSGSISNYLVDSNVLYNICTGIRDCGAIYSQDLSSASTNLKITNNYVRDGAVFDTSGWGAGIYLDDCTNNYIVKGNVLTGENGGNNIMIHGGSNDVFSDNLTDISTFGSVNTILRFQSSSCSSPTGNSFEGNIVISNGNGGGYNGISGTVTVSNNAYWNYASGGSSFNVGYTTTPTGGSGNSYTAGYNFANGPYTMSGTGTIQSCSVWLATGPSGSMECGVYSAVSSSQPGTLLAHSGSFTPVAGWNTVVTTTNPSVTSGTVIFMGAIDTVSNATLEDSNSGFNLYGDNDSETTLQTTFLNPANLDASTFQLGAYATFNGSGGGTGITTTGDTNPVVENPQLSCWGYNIASGSPVFSSPVNFTDFTRGWGPPGYTIPHTGTVPSSPHTC